MPFLCLVDPAFQILCRFILPNLCRLSNLPGKLLLVFNRIFAHCADRFQRQRTKCVRGYAVRKALSLGSFDCQRIGRAIIGINERLPWRIGSGLVLTVVIHPGSTVCAEHQSCKRICFAGRIYAMLGALRPLCKPPCILVNDGLMGILKDKPIFRAVSFTFVLV